MNKYSVLVVDDEPDVCDLFAEHFAPNADQIRVITANTVSAAYKVISNEFINLAFIDMEFLPENLKHGGVLLARELEKRRPSAKVVLLTQYPSEYSTHLMTLLNPVRPLIVGVINKADSELGWKKVIDWFASRWLRNPIDVQGLDEVRRILAGRNVGDQNLSLTTEELDFVVSSMLGQGRSRVTEAAEDGPFDPADDFAVKGIAFSPLLGGRSSSVVVVGRPSVGDHEGIRCVIKFSPKAEAREEYDRYCRFVRFMVNLTYRVELLGFCEGDLVGAMCYSFAGKSPESVSSLDQMFKTQSPRASEVLEALFHPDERFWYKIPGSPIELREYFKQAYSFRSAPVEDDIAKFMEGLQVKIPEFNLKGGNLVVPGGVIQSPKLALAKAIMERPQKTTIVHGDMNANNVIVSSNDKRVILIDYRHTGYGPRAIDFAALECSLRLALESDGSSCLLLVGEQAREEDVWRAVWSASGKREKLHEALNKKYWMRVSYELGCHARSNHSDLEPKEYAATCLLWAMRVFRVRGLTEVQRFRLLLWMSHLTRQLS